MIYDSDNPKQSKFASLGTNSIGISIVKKFTLKNVGVYGNENTRDYIMKRCRIEESKNKKNTEINRLQLAYERHETKWNRCVNCVIGEQCNKHVIGRGSIPADILFVGEAPGFEEDKQGKPFIGRSGKLLDKIISKAISTKSYFITNTVCCIPKDYIDNKKIRQPSEVELHNCSLRLKEIIEISNSKAIILVGQVALSAFEKIFGVHLILDLQNPDWFNCMKSLNLSVPLLTIYHPSFLLRKGGESSEFYKTTIKKIKTFISQINSLKDK